MITVNINVPIRIDLPENYTMDDIVWILESTDQVLFNKRLELEGQPQLLIENLTHNEIIELNDEEN